METQSSTPQPLIQSQKQRQSKKKRSEKCCYIFSCWLLSLIMWFFLFLFVYNLLVDKKKKLGYIFAEIPFYIAYVILELCSQSNKYLCKKKKDVSLADLLESLFQAKPIVSVHCECYHTESSYVSDGDEGHYETTTVTTYREVKPINYYSCRDVSGLFVLNTNEKKISRKAYIELELEVDINFGDPVSYKEFEYIKTDMRIRNEKRDESFSLKEDKYIEGMKNKYFLRLQDHDPKCFNCGWFLFFTILTFAEFYKFYINSKVIFQKFKIRKLVSNRYDLSSEIFNKKYEKFNPQVNLINSQISYDRNTFIHVLIENRKPEPNEYELSDAKIYERCLPRYEINTEADIGRAGTVKDLSNGNYIPANLSHNNNISKQNGINDKKSIQLTTLNNDLLNDQNNNETNKLIP